MVALLSNLIRCFRYVVSLAPSVPILSALSAHLSSMSHPSGLPLPQVMHRNLNKDFIDRFEEIVVIGDVHGCYNEMIKLLSQIDDGKNNQDRILKLFVGDLVNKGPNSKQVLAYMMENKDKCLSVRGNHDEVVIREYLSFEDNGKSALTEKNHWITDLSRSQIDYLISLPYTITIPCLNTLIVHAGIVPGVDLVQQNIKDMIEMRNLVDDKTTNKMIATSDHKTGNEWVSRWTGPLHVFFGHDAKRKLQKTRFATGLDTGCVYGNSLTAMFIYGPRKGTLVSQRASAVYSEPKIKKPL